MSKTHTSLTAVKAHIEEQINALEQLQKLAARHKFKSTIQTDIEERLDTWAGFRTLLSEVVKL